MLQNMGSCELGWLQVPFIYLLTFTVYLNVTTCCCYGCPSVVVWLPTGFLEKSGRMLLKKWAGSILEISILTTEGSWRSVGHRFSLLGKMSFKILIPCNFFHRFSPVLFSFLFQFCAYFDCSVFWYGSINSSSSNPWGFDWRPTFSDADLSSSFPPGKYCRIPVALTF